MFKKKYSLLKYFGKSKLKRTMRKKRTHKRHKICRSNNHCKRYTKSKKMMRGG